VVEAYLAPTYKYAKNDVKLPENIVLAIRKYTLSVDLSHEQSLNGCR